MAQSRAESTRDTYNYGQYLNQFAPNTIKVIREFERIQKKICRHKMSIMFNEICIYIYIRSSLDGCVFYPIEDMILIRYKIIVRKYIFTQPFPSRRECKKRSTHKRGSVNFNLVLFPQCLTYSN